MYALVENLVPRRLLVDSEFVSHNLRLPFQSYPKNILQIRYRCTYKVTMRICAAFVKNTNNQIYIGNGDWAVLDRRFEGFYFLYKMKGLIFVFIREMLSLFISKYCCGD